LARCLCVHKKFMVHYFSHMMCLLGLFKFQGFLAGGAKFLNTNTRALALRNPFSLLLHTYLVDIWPLMNGLDGNTRPPLHIGASRIIDFPSGTSSAEFLIASRLVLSTFHCDHCFAQCHEEEIRIALFLLSGSNIKVFLVE